MRPSVGITKAINGPRRFAAHFVRPDRLSCQSVDKIVGNDFARAKHSPGRQPGRRHRDVPHNRVGSSTPPSPPYRNLARGKRVGLGGDVRVGLTRAIHGPRRFAAHFVRPDRLSCRSVEPSGFVHTALSAIYEKTRLRGLFRIWRRGWDSNPRGALSPQPISSRCRYDHFGTSPRGANSNRKTCATAIIRTSERMTGC